MNCSTPGSSVLPCRPLSWWLYLTTSSSACPFSFCWIFPSISVFSSRLFALGDQSIGASAAILPMNIQGWFALGLTGLISLQSKGLSQVFSNTTVQKHQFFSTRSSDSSALSPAHTSIHDYWKIQWQPVNFYPDSRSSGSSVIVQPLSQPGMEVFLKLCSLLRDTLSTICQYQQYPIEVLDCYQ